MRLLNSARAAGTLRIWDIECRDKTIVLEGHQATVNGAVHTTDGNILYWSDDLAIRLWNPRNGACLNTFAADWVETDDFPGYWQQHAERAGAYFRGTWWVQAIDRHVSMG